MEPGDRFIASKNLYGGSITQFGGSFKRLGWHCDFCDPGDPESFRAAIQENTKAIFIEVLANPGGIIVDIEAIAAIANEAGIPLIVDNTLATPYLFRPFEWGCRSDCPFGDQVSWRPRELARRSDRRVRQLQLVGVRTLPRPV